MIILDTRTGSKDLLEPLKRVGLPVELGILEYADLAFTGKGDEGKSVEVGIEYKKLQELIGSIRDGRFGGHQLPGMLGERGMYDYGWLLIEGMWRHSDQGEIVTYQGRERGWVAIRGGMLASEYEKHLLTFELCGGIHVRSTNSRRDTLRVVASLYRWWSDRALDEHTSHLVVHRPHSWVPLTPFRQAVMAWPGVGTKVSKVAEEYFVNDHGKASIKVAANATVGEWACIETKDKKGRQKRFGEAAAHKLHRFLEGGAV